MSTQQNAPLPHKERLLRQGLKHFYDRGFHGTTVDAILEASGVPKGSFYHHFGSKEEFARAVLNRYTDFQLALLDRWASTPELSATDRLGRYVEELAELFRRSGYRRACLSGKLSTEVAVGSDTFREQIGASLLAWREHLAALLAQGQEAGDVRTDRTAEELATAILTLIQGTFVLCIATRDEEALKAVRSTIHLLVARPGRG
jgi:TetR/AcrR family transcriptional regulator, transcriptional repressor for nem operon